MRTKVTDSASTKAPNLRHCNVRFSAEPSCLRSSALMSANSCRHTATQLDAVLHSCSRVKDFLMCSNQKLIANQMGNKSEVFLAVPDSLAFLNATAAFVLNINAHFACHYH